jgi:hypothetical protein
MQDMPIYRVPYPKRQRNTARFQSKVIGALLAAGAMTMLTSPAMADWRDYMGKMLVADVKASSRTINDVISARGGASETDDVINSECDMIYRLYLSSKGRLFMFLSRIACAGSDPFDPEAPNGSIFDLTVAEGMSDNGRDSPQTPYSTKFEADEMVITQRQIDYTWKGIGYQTTFSNATGLYTTRIRFADDCSISIEGKSSYRMEYLSTDSDYYSLQDNESTYDLKTVSCRVVEGFQIK